MYVLSKLVYEYTFSTALRVLKTPVRAIYSVKGAGLEAPLIEQH